ncbi:MAG: endonuclease/exonuclease/phosphatase family protein [Blastocatellia bacterium]|nr:endonuclease/exonuclease/phosphatase family protein [Blastocatellia bacterium]
MSRRMLPGEEILHEVNYRSLIEQLRRFSTLKQLYRSDAYRAHQQALFWVLSVPQPYLLQTARPRLHDFVRVVQWNIEKGKNFEGLVETFSAHPILRYADLILLNEVDYGMARSGQRHVARELGQWLGMHVAFAPAHLELTKGVGDDRSAEGDNQTALQGNAILSRYPMDQLRIIDLPTQFEPFEFEEKRFGRRIALVAEVFINREKLTVVSTHLEVRATPRGRAKQMAALLARLDHVEGPVLIGGDFNTAIFSRGNRWRTFQSIARLLWAEPAQLKDDLLHPDKDHREPLFDLLRRHGFSFEAFNTREATHRASLSELEENDHLPALLRNWVIRKLRQYDFRLDFKLDWIAGRQISPLTADQLTDSHSGIASISPQTIKHLTYQGRKIADHDPIVVDIRLTEVQRHAQESLMS